MNSEFSKALRPFTIYRLLRSLGVHNELGIITDNFFASDLFNESFVNTVPHITTVAISNPAKLEFNVNNFFFSHVYPEIVL